MPRVVIKWWLGEKLLPVPVANPELVLPAESEPKIPPSPYNRNNMIIIRRSNYLFKPDYGYGVGPGYGSGGLLVAVGGGRVAVGGKRVDVGDTLVDVGAGESVGLGVDCRGGVEVGYITVI
jgi:hypothetical protein